MTDQALEYGLASTGVRLGWAGVRLGWTGVRQIKGEERSFSSLEREVNLMKSDTLECRILNGLNKHMMLANFNYRGCFTYSGAPVLQWQTNVYQKCL